MQEEEKVNIEDILISYKLISSEEAASLKMESMATGRDIKELIMEKGLVSEDALFYAISMELNLPFVTLDPDSIDVELVKSIPIEVMKSYKFIPIIIVDEEVRVAVADPTNKEIIEYIKNIFTGKKVAISVALPSNILDTIEAVFATDIEITKLTSPAVAIFYSALTEAISKSAEALYFEPIKEKMRIRMRSQGRLITYEEHPEEFIEPIINKIKETVKIHSSNSGSMRTILGGKDVYITAGVINSVSVDGAFMLFRYPKKENVTLKSLPLTEEEKGLIENKLWMGNSCILISGIDIEFREEIAIALIKELNPYKRKVIGLLWEDIPVDDVEKYLFTNSDDMNKNMELFFRSGVDTVYIQDIRKNGVDIYKVLRLAEVTTVIATISTATGVSAISYIQKMTNDISQDDRNISLIVETIKKPLACPECSELQWIIGKGCKKCDYSGVKGYEKKINLLTYQ